MIGYAIKVDYFSQNNQTQPQQKKNSEISNIYWMETSVLKTHLNFFYAAFYISRS